VVGRESENAFVARGTSQILIVYACARGGLSFASGLLSDVLLDSIRRFGTILPIVFFDESCLSVLPDTAWVLPARVEKLLCVASHAYRYASCMTNAPFPNSRRGVVMPSLRKRLPLAWEIRSLSERTRC
jgi:hypothetical protein